MNDIVDSLECTSQEAGFRRGRWSVGGGGAWRGGGGVMLLNNDDHAEANFDEPIVLMKLLQVCLTKPTSLCKFIKDKNSVILRLKSNFSRQNFWIKH